MGIKPGFLRLPFPGDGLSRAATIALVGLITLGALEPILPFGDTQAIGLGPRLGSPAAAWPLGTDALGRSMLPRVLEGILLTFLLSTVAVVVAGVIGAVIGMAAGYFGRVFGEVTARIADMMFSFPPVLLGLLVTAIIGPGILSAMAAIFFVSLPAMIRVVRVATLDLATRDFVVLAEIAGASLVRKLFVHILPNVAGVIAVQAAYSISLGMLLESALSFLGLGVQPPSASLGALLREGSPYLAHAPWLIFAPGAVLALSILSVNLFGDGLRELVDPLEPRPLI